MSIRARKFIILALIWMMILLVLLACIGEFTGYLDADIQQAYSSYIHFSEFFQTAEPIFLAIVVEAMPFILIGSLISSLIQEWITEEQLARWLPNSPSLSILAASLMGFLLPVCDCGTIPVARGLLKKKVRVGSVIAFTLGAPTVNPITLLATFFAFGLSFRMVALRLVCSLAIACMVGFVIQRFFSPYHEQMIRHLTGVKEMGAAEEEAVGTERRLRKSAWDRLRSVCEHTVHELFEIVGFLIISAFVASTFAVVRAAHPLGVLSYSRTAEVAIMMLFAILFSLCSEADAFVARTFMPAFAPGAVLAFMLISQMADARNLFLLPRTFGRKIAATSIGLCMILTFCVGTLL